MKRTAWLAGMVFLIAAVPAAALPVTFDSVFFTVNGKSNGAPLAPDFIMNSCWGAIATHHNGNVYVAVSNEAYPNGNAAIFKYDPAKDAIRLLGDIKSVSQAANNWLPGESQQKIHTRLLEHADGTIYCATHDYANTGEALSDHRGAHIYTIDGNDRITDYSKTSHYYINKTMATVEGNIGVALEHYSILAMGLNPRAPDLIYALTIPDGYLLRLNVSTGSIKNLCKTTTSAATYLSRELAVDNGGNAYVAIRTAGDAKQVYKYNTATDTWAPVGQPFTDNNTDANKGGFACQVLTPSGDALYAMAFTGDIYRLEFATGKLTRLGNNGGSSPPVRNLLIGKDGKNLYYLAYGYSSRKVLFQLRAFNLENSTYSVVEDNLVRFYGETDLFYGCTIDGLGNAYWAAWSYKGTGVQTNIMLIKAHFGVDILEPNPPHDIWKAGITNEPVTAGKKTIRHAGNNPNPFTGATTIGFTLQRRETIVISIHDAQGRLVKTADRGIYGFGRHAVLWDGTDQRNRRVKDGVYVYRIASRTDVHEGTMVLAR